MRTSSSVDIRGIRVMTEILNRPAIVIITALLFLTFSPNGVDANPPQSVSLEYLPGMQKLNVSIAHVVLDNTTHYIFQVEIQKNGVVNITANYTSQPTNDVFNYTYDISAVDGDVLLVTARCVLFGETSKSLTVSTGPPPDNVPPSVSISSPTNLQKFNSNAITVNGTASDNAAVAKVEVSLNNGSWMTATGITSWSAPMTIVLGPNFILARATDTSNNTGQDFVYVTLVNGTGPPPDTVPPSISISSPQESQTVNLSRMDVRGTSSDSGGVRFVEVRLDGGAWAAATGNLSWNATMDIAEGANRIEARATDFSNNTASAVVNVTYTNNTGPPPDTVKPVVAIAQPSEGRKFNVTTVSVAGTASDNVGLNKVEVRVNSGAWKPATGTAAWTATVTLVNGSNRIEAMVFDTSGNTATASVNVTYEQPAPPPLDRTPPAMNITGPANGSIYTSRDITVNGTASDNIQVERVEARIGTGAWTMATGTTSWTILLSLAEGQNTIEARAADSAGNTVNASLNIFYSKPGTPTLDGIIIQGEYDHKAVFSSGSYELHWKVLGEIIRMAIVGRTSGWVAIGLSPTMMMKDADMIGGWVDSGGKAGIIDCYSTGPNGPHPTDQSLSPPGTYDIIEYGGSESAGTTTVEFTRLLRTGDRYDHDIPANGTLSFIWALGSGDDFNFQHLDRGYGTINITTGASTERAAMAWQPHAILMGSGIGLLVAGMLVARLKKKKWWMKGHRTVMLAGAALTVSGLIYGYYMIQVSTGMHMRVIHTYFGLTSILLTLSMVASGFALPRLVRAHPVIRPAHRWLGRATILFLVLSVLMGLAQAGIIILG